MNERFKLLREALNMSQEEFGKLIGITKSGVSDIENGRRKVTEQHIIMLKTQISHNISEEWLRTGSGEMFLTMDRDEEIAMWVDGILHDENNGFKKRLISALFRLDDNSWTVIENLINELSNSSN